MDNINIGFDAAEEEVKAAPDKPKRLPYATWTVAGREYKMKLTADKITRLEKQFGRNLLMVITDDGLPPLGTMLTVIQAALMVFQHNIKFVDVQTMYDDFVDEGGDQTELLKEVIMPLMAVSGFFTLAQATELQKEMEEL